MYKFFFKRVIDIIISLVLLICTSPILISIIFLLFIVNNRKIFFIQPRPGINKKVFNLIKFKTMNDVKDENGNLLPDEQRITWLGAFIRKSSIDELPQLINVLKGDMSLIGPRPLLVEYLDYYSEEQIKRQLIRPGITGWAQVNGRNSISWNEKFELDVWYVNNISFWLDVKIILLTIKNIITIKHINAKGFATMPKFNGKN